jgi:hypothetical protein
MIKALLDMNAISPKTAFQASTTLSDQRLDRIANVLQLPKWDDEDGWAYVPERSAVEELVLTELAEVDQERHAAL